MDAPQKSIVRRNPVPESISRPVVPPLCPSVVYQSETPDQLDQQYEGAVAGYTYAREGHPNASMLANKIDWLENTSGGVATSSGMAAISAAFLALLKQGDHVVASSQLYGRTLRLLTQDLPRMGIDTTFVDPTDIDAVKSAVRPETKLIVVEVVANPTLRIADMDGIVQLKNDCDAMLMIDNTFTTPIAYQAVTAGADVVVHSVTKLLAGHSDVTLGYVVASDREINRAIGDAVVTWGFTPSPWDCWLAERGLHSFNLRYERAEKNAVELADFLTTQPGIEAIIYPARTDHPDYLRCQRLLGGHGGNMVSFRLEGGRAAANALTKAAPQIPFAPTLGDVGTTLSHPPSSSHRGLTEKDRQSLGITQGFFRVSVGIEDIELLKREFQAAILAAWETTKNR